MKRVAICAVLVLFGLGGPLRAEEPKKFYLVDGVVIEKRVSDLEARVAALEDALAKATAAPAAKGGCVCGPNCACAAGTCPSCPTAGPGAAAHLYAAPVTICENGVCRTVSTAPAVSAPALYASPVRASTCAGGSCSTGATRGGWYPGKLLGRR